MSRDREKRATKNTEKNLEIRPLVEERKGGEVGFDPVPPCLSAAQNAFA